MLLFFGTAFFFLLDDFLRLLPEVLEPTLFLGGSITEGVDDGEFDGAEVGLLLRETRQIAHQFVDVKGDIGSFTIVQDVDENISIVARFEGTFCPQEHRSWLKYVAVANIEPIWNTCETSQESKGWLKFVAEENMNAISTTFETSQESKGWSKFVAESNMYAISTTFETSHEIKGWLKFVAE